MEISPHFGETPMEWFILTIGAGGALAWLYSGKAKTEERLKELEEINTSKQKHIKRLERGIDDRDEKIAHLHELLSQAQNNQAKLRKSMDPIVEFMHKIEVPDWINEHKFFFEPLDKTARNSIIKRPETLIKLKEWAERAAKVWREVDLLSRDSRRVFEEACQAYLTKAQPDENPDTPEISFTPLVREAAQVITEKPPFIEVNLFEVNSDKLQSLIFLLDLLRHISPLEYVHLKQSWEKLEKQLRDGANGADSSYQEELGA